MEFIKSLNWVDILIIVLGIRIVYVSIQTGFVTEFMKVLAVLLVIFAGFHFYTKMGGLLTRFTGLPAPVTEMAAFTLIWVAIAVAFKLIRDGIFMVFTVQTLSAVDRWGAVVVSVGRFFLTASMVLFIFLVSDRPYLERMVSSSLVQKYVLTGAPDMYRKMTQGLVVKFFPGEKVNPAVTEELFEPGKK